METRLKAMPIQAHTKGELKRLRKMGLIPVSLQHKGEETRHFQMPLRPLLEFVRHHGESAIVEVDTGNGTEAALLHDVRRDGVTHLPLQVTFMKVVRGEPIKAHVALVFEGEPEPVAEGTAVLQPVLDHLEVRCLPSELPENIKVDVSQMQFGDILHVSDVRSTDRIEVLNAPDSVVVSLASLLRRTADEEDVAEPVAEEPVEQQAEQPAEEESRAA
jgi:large subunit ribosomal protein L25